jgi:hypothetical protein
MRADGVVCNVGVHGEKFCLRVPNLQGHTAWIYHHRHANLILSETAAQVEPIGMRCSTPRIEEDNLPQVTLGTGSLALPTDPRAGPFRHLSANGDKGWGRLCNRLAPPCGGLIEVVENQPTPHGFCLSRPGRRRLQGAEPATIEVTFSPEDSPSRAAPPTSDLSCSSSDAVTGHFDAWGMDSALSHPRSVSQLRRCHVIRALSSWHILVCIRFRS